MATASGHDGGSKDSNCNPPQWMDVARTDRTKITVVGTVKGSVLKKTTTQDDESADEQPRFQLESGKTYKFQVAAVNSLGAGPWSQMATYLVPSPDRPPAPSKVQVCRISYGAVILWEMPPDLSADIAPIEEYGVFLSMKVGKDEAIPNAKPYFVHFYRGTERVCVITKELLDWAAIERSGGKSFMVFRIAARNKVGFGPSTEVHWLQN